ncbi:hypothetical protein [Methylobacterium soli]|uniref:hypothetical protein n=1 Tax=Methylobacterium soli TaxID=553447 RepID=UPI001EE18F86|nr:hypothetical protein [Methylobacterium soli]
MPSTEPDAATGAGFGLNLHIVRQIALALAHPIDVRSRRDRGSVFGVTAPVHRPARP